jgi:signal transduction histidine kinase
VTATGVLRWVRQRWRTRRLATRIGLAILLALAAMQLFAALVFFLSPQPRFVLLSARWVAASAVEAYRVAAGGGTEVDLGKLASAAHLEFRILPSLPAPPPGLEEQQGFWPQQRLGPIIAQALGGSAPVRVMGAGPPPGSGPSHVATVPENAGASLPRGPLRDDEPDLFTPEGFAVAVGLPDGRALLIDSRPSGPRSRQGLPFYLTLAGAAALIAAMAILTARSLLAPLGKLAALADRLGRERNPVVVDDLTIPEFRSIATAFSTMHARLTRFVDERTQMLAAISHDLRTPLTRLTLAAEYVTDPRQRAELQASLNDMKVMLEETLAFAAQDARREEHRLLDLAALLASLCDEAEDNGTPFTYEGPLHAIVSARPVAIRRAFSNLLRNAALYAGGGRITLAVEGTDVVVIVADDGPGLPEEDLERVFQPFTRGEGSRNRDTGGTGLGLTIARDLILGHGGTIELQRGGPGLPGTGLIVRVRLPDAPLET